MVFSYKKLWKLLVEKDMKKSDLRSAAKLSSSTIAKLNRGKNISTAVLLKICAALHYNEGDIMRTIPDEALPPEKAVARRDEDTDV